MILSELQSIFGFMNKINIKPLSVNEVWQGKRFKTTAYKSYEKSLLLLLPNFEIPKGKLKIYFEFGFSNSQSDIDNPVKPILDILQKKYGFNDSQVYEMNVKKEIVKKGSEYIKIEIE